MHSTKGTKGSIASSPYSNQAYSIALPCSFSDAKTSNVSPMVILTTTLAWYNMGLAGVLDYSLTANLDEIADGISLEVGQG